MKKFDEILFKQALKIKKGAIIKNVNQAIENIFQSIVTETPTIEKKDISLILKVEHGQAVAILVHDCSPRMVELAREPLSTSVQMMVSPEQIAQVKEILETETIDSMLCKMIGERIFCIGYDQAPTYDELTPNGVESLDLGEFITSIKL